MTVLQAISFLAAHASTANALHLQAAAVHPAPVHQDCPLVFQDITEQHTKWFGRSKFEVTVVECDKELNLRLPGIVQICKIIDFPPKVDNNLSKKEGVKQYVNGCINKYNGCKTEQCKTERKKASEKLLELDKTTKRSNHEAAIALTKEMSKKFRSAFDERIKMLKEQTAEMKENAKKFLERISVPPKNPRKRLQDMVKKVIVVNKINKAFWENAGVAAARRQHLSSDDQALSEFYNIVHIIINMVLGKPTNYKYIHFHVEYVETLKLYRGKLTESGQEKLKRFNTLHRPSKAVTEEEFKALKDAVSLAAAKILDHDVRKASAAEELEEEHKKTLKRLAGLQKNEEFSKDFKGQVEEETFKGVNLDFLEKRSKDGVAVAAAAEGQAENAETMMTETTQVILKNPGTVLSGMLIGDLSVDDFADGPSMSTAARIGGNLLIDKGIDLLKDHGISFLVKSEFFRKSKELRVAKQVACEEVFRALMDIEHAGDSTTSDTPGGFNMFGLRKALAKLEDAEKAIAADESRRAEVEKQLEVAAEYLRTFLKFILNVVTKLSAVVDPTSPITWAVVAVLSMTPIGPLGPIVAVPIVALVSFGLSKLLGYLADKLISRISKTDVGRKILSTSVGTVKLLTEGVNGTIQTGVENALSTSVDFVGKKMSHLAEVISKKSSKAMTTLKKECPESIAYLKGFKESGVARCSGFMKLGKNMLLSTTKWAGSSTPEQLEEAITYEEDWAKSGPADNRNEEVWRKYEALVNKD